MTNTVCIHIFRWFNVVKSNTYID